MIFAISERLILRRVRADDYEPLLASWSDPETARWTGAKDDLPGFIAGMIADMEVKRPGDDGPGGPWYQYVVERREDGALVGDLGAGFGVPGERQVELGYRILTAHRGRGYAREAVAALIDHLIDSHCTHRFVGVAAAPNLASKRLLLALGFRHEGHFRSSFWCNGEWLDDDYFALLASEWRGRAA